MSDRLQTTPDPTNCPCSVRCDEAQTCQHTNWLFLPVLLLALTGCALLEAPEARAARQQQLDDRLDEVELDLIYSP